MNIAQLIAQLRATMAAKLTERNRLAEELNTLRSVEAPDETKVAETRKAKADLDAELDALEVRLTELKAEQERDDAMARLAREITPTGVRPPVPVGGARVGAEERTYAPHRERGFDASTGQFRREAKPGAQFERDVIGAFLGDYEARERLVRHMAEERVERGEYLSRAVGTGAFVGLTVPQYLTDLYAPAAAARRPFADAIRHHDLPASGMTVNISRITTASSSALQASQNTAVSETNMDDTLLTVDVKTNAGQQTVSRQAIERGSGVEPIVLDDLFRRYATTLDSTLINEASVGLTNVATSIAYTDASPTVAELYPKVIQGLSAVEAALLDMASGDNIAVMHSRRWYWMQNALVSTWPLVAQPGIMAQMGATNLATAYGSGVRGVLPNGTPVIVDNSVATNLGAGTNEDEIYILDREEAHLWEDGEAPLFIRAEQTPAASLGVLLVVYGYFAYTFQRYTQAQKLAGTGLVTPTFTGV